MSWPRLQAQAADLAAYGARRLTDAQVAYLATTDRAGAPRVHPVTSIVTSQGLFVFMEPTSPKGRDLERGSSYALHCAVEDADGSSGEFTVRGTARRVTDPALRAVVAAQASYDPAERYVLYELGVDDALATRYADDGTPLRQRWRAS